MLQEEIKKLAKQYAPEFIEVRHHLHENPELSYEEYETSKFVQQKLKQFGIAFDIKATTGVVGLIKGKNPGNASLMIRDGVLENPKPAAIFGLHVHPGLQIGKASFREGKVMASADEL